MSRLKQMAVRRLDFEFSLPVEPALFDGVEGARHVEVDGRDARVDVEGPLTQVMKVVADHEVVNLRVREADLEEIFLAYYRDPTGSQRARTSLPRS